MRSECPAARFLATVLPELRCHLFPSRLAPASPANTIHNKTFSHWKSIWEEILHLPEGGALPADSFLRQDLLCSVTHQEAVIGMIAASFFPAALSAFAHHSYLQPFFASPRFDQKSAGGADMMSIEYLSVDPAFRKAELGLSLGSVLLGLSMEIFRNTQARLVLGTARSQIHVDEMCYHFGFSACGEMEKFGHPCTLIVNTKETLRRHDDLLVRRAVERLWNHRRDYRETAAAQIAA